MAFTASAVIEVQTGGSDATGVGVFDPGVAGMDATGSVASANTSAPIVTVNGEAAGDVNMWFYLKSATNSVPGWYPITAVDTTAHTYTLNAAIGAAILTNYTTNTAVGCCSSGSTLSSVTWAVDFSQTTGNIATGTVTTAAAVATATTAIFRKPMVGNGITQGTAWRVIIGYTSTTVVTLDASPTWTAVSASIGAALASPGQAGAIQVQGAKIWVKTGTYTVTSASNNVAAGCLSLTAGAATTATFVSGYSALRGDNLGTALMKADGVITTFTLCTLAADTYAINFQVDGNSRTSSKGFSVAANSQPYLCTAKNCTNSAFIGPGNGTANAVRCYATGCSTVAAFAGLECFCCVADTNTFTGFLMNQCRFYFCISSNNSGSTSDGFGDQNNIMGGYFNCIAYNNGRNGFMVSNGRPTIMMNCIASTNGVTSGTGYGVSSINVSDAAILQNNAFFGNKTGDINTTNVPTRLTFGTVTLGSDPFIAAGSGNFALTPAAIALLAGIPGSFPGLASTTGYLYIGAVQPNNQGIFVATHTAMIVNPLTVVGY